MSGIATAIIGSSIIGGITSSNAAGKAADAQTQASNASIAEQQRQYDQSRADIAPWRDAGLTTLPQLTSGLAPGGDFNRDFTLADFQKDPGYQFRLQQGQQALEASAAARGGLLSGGTGKALARYGQDFASNEYGNAYSRWNNDRSTRFNRLSALAGTGQTATTNLATLGQNTANAISGSLTDRGNAQAAGYIGRGNAINDTIGSLGSFYLQSQYLKKLPSFGGGTPVGGSSGSIFGAR